MKIERKKIEWYGNGGHITLDYLAVPESVRIILDGKQIIPASFDCYGHPNFTREQQEMYTFKQAIEHRKKTVYTPLEVEVTYEERGFSVPRRSFDTRAGIESALESLEAFNELIDNRKRFFFVSRRERLNGFVVFGRFLLNTDASVYSIERKMLDKVKVACDVDYVSSFIRRHSDTFAVSSAGFTIPKAGEKCPCCGKHFTIDDVKDEVCVFEDEKTYHYSCYREYKKITEVDILNRRIIGSVYNARDYEFELLPNGYCKEACCEHIPWMKFSTIDGDIIIGRRKRVISIEWQETYKPFALEELFGDENVTKWEENGKRGIHANNPEKAYEYLRKARAAVNPNYSYV